VTGGWRELHNVVCHDLHSSPSVITNIKFRRMRWVRHVARIVEKWKAYRLLVGKSEGKRPPERPRRREITSKGSCRDRMVWLGLVLSRSGEGKVERFCECGKEHSRSIKLWKTIE
jgi:hypothetical protein